MKRREIQTRLGRFEALCRERGLPLTVQRRRILQAVLERDDHPTAHQVYESVKQRIPELSRTTVYRALDTLVELGVIRRVDHPESNARFDGNVQQHHHAICRGCHKLLDIEDAALDELPAPRAGLRGFEIEGHTVQFFGLCAECKRKPD